MLDRQILREAAAYDVERSGRSGTPPDGYVYVVAVEDDRWRAQDEGLCARRLPTLVGGHYHMCHNPAVAAFNRWQRRGGVKRDAWWPYCADHMYGRWVEDDHVVVLVLNWRASDV